MRLFDKAGKQIGVQDGKGKNFFFKKSDIANPPKDYDLRKPVKGDKVK